MLVQPSGANLCRCACKDTGKLTPGAPISAQRRHQRGAKTHAKLVVSEQKRCLSSGVVRIRCLGHRDSSAGGLSSRRRATRHCSASAPGGKAFMALLAGSAAALCMLAAAQVQCRVAPGLQQQQSGCRELGAGGRGKQQAASGKPHLASTYAIHRLPSY